MYVFESRVPYSRITQKMELSLEGVIDLLQDCATFHSEDVGFTCKRLGGMNLGWFVTDYQIHIKRIPEMGQRLLVETYPYGIKGMMASRYYKIKTVEGEELITANSMWVLMNIKEGKPQRVSDELKEAYGDDGAPAEEFEHRKVPVISNLSESDIVHVEKSMLDTNNHVNNGRYITLAESYIAGGIGPGSVRIEYKKQATLGDELHILSGSDEQGKQVLMTTGDVDDPYFKLLYTEAAS